MMKKELTTIALTAALSHYTLRLYVAGMTPRSTIAIANIRAICGAELEGRCSLEIIDLYLKPKLAAADQIIAVPTLIRNLPSPARRIIGDLSDRGKVLSSLELEPKA